MGLCQDKRSTMPATVTYGYFIPIIPILDKLLKCLDPLEVYEIWYMCERQTMRHAAFLHGCLMKLFVRAFGALITRS
jgi:hypothetical protein